MNWFILVLGALATFRLQPSNDKRTWAFCTVRAYPQCAVPGGRGSIKEWLSCILVFSLSASAVVCVILWGRRSCSQLGVLGFALVEFQFRFPLGPQGLWMTKCRSRR